MTVQMIDEVTETENYEKLESYFPDLDHFHESLEEIQQRFPGEEYRLQCLAEKFESFYKEGLTLDQRVRYLISSAVELTSENAPRWECIASYFYDLLYKKHLKETWKKRILEGKVPGVRDPEESLSFYQKVLSLDQGGLYAQEILETYSEEDLNEAEGWMVPQRDLWVNYPGYDLLVSRYVIKSFDLVPLESVQEMYLGIALFLAIPEKKDRLTWAHRFYRILSTLKVTLATPTLANARKPFHQLSSCFIDTVPDDLQGIYKSISNFANVSKFGGGMGLYFGKVRAQGSAIRHFKGAAGGIIRWVRLANDTAVAVDQLGVRQGACACYLDIWHKDVPEFIQIRTNNGDDRMKAHDIFPALCYPNYFWDQVENHLDGQWGLLDPHEVSLVKGYALEDSYGEEWTEKYLDCLADDRISKRWIPLKELVRLIIRSLVETGTPFAFNRDLVNEANPNKDKGIIYSSNLCTEIAQNMSESTITSEEILDENGDPVIVTKTLPGDYVTCNLASLNLGKIDLEDPEDLKEAVTSAVRALDNVIEMNFFPVPAAKINNHKYRSIGLGVSGYHHMLANHHIFWESQAHLDFADQVFEKINFYTIQASMENARDKGPYPYFKGSEWDSGRYFSRRSYDSPAWQDLAKKVHENGLRNGYLLAIAPTSSTSIIAGTSPGVDPVTNTFYYDEKKSGLIPRVAPDLNFSNYVYYNPAHETDQSWSIRAAGIRARHIDQAASMNLYITNDYSFRKILALYLQAYREGVKTIYYIRSKSLEVEECRSCSL